MRRRLSAAAMAAALLVLAGAARAADVFVDQAAGSDLNDGLSWATAKQTANAALQVALATPEGDAMHIAEGVYCERLNWLYTPVDLLGGYASGGATRDAELHRTVFDGEGAGAGGVADAMISTSWPGAPMLVEGITVRRAGSGALAIVDTELTIRDCVFEDNGLQWARSGVPAVDLLSYNVFAPTLIERCTFRHDALLIAEWVEAADYAAALKVEVRGLVTVRDCVFDNNYTSELGPVDFYLHTQNFMVLENVRADAGYLSSSELTLSNVLLRRYLEVPCNLQRDYPWLFTNVTMGQLRVLVDADWRQPLTVVDTIIAGLVDGQSVPGIDPGGCWGMGVIAMDHSLVRGGWPTGTNIIDLDPGFASGPLGDQYLAQVAAGDASTSPAVDSGSRDATAAAMDALTTRVDGGTDAGIVDMGYHFPPVTSFTIRRSTNPMSLVPVATLSRMPWLDAPGTASDPALRLLFYDVPEASNAILVTLDRTADAPQLDWR